MKSLLNQKDLNYLSMFNNVFKKFPTTNVLHDHKDVRWSAYHLVSDEDRRITGKKTSGKVRRKVKYILATCFIYTEF